MIIADLLARRAPVVHLLEPEQPVSEAVRVMADREVGAVLIREYERLVGIFTEQDVVRRVLARGRSTDVTLRSVMTAEPLTAKPDEAVRLARSRMQHSRSRHLPIVQEGRILDTLSIRDLLVTELGEREREVDELQRYIRGDPKE